MGVDIVGNTGGRGKNISVHSFGDTEDNMERWALYIAYNRNKIDNKESYRKLVNFVDNVNKNDLMIGDITDDKMFQAFNAFYSGDMTIKGLIYYLDKADIGRQYVLKQIELVV